MADLAMLAKTMRQLRDDARERGPALRPIALFYAQEAVRLAAARLKKFVRDTKRRHG